MLYVRSGGSELAVVDGSGELLLLGALDGAADVLDVLAVKGGATLVLALVREVVALVGTLEDGAHGTPAREVIAKPPRGTSWLILIC